VESFVDSQLFHGTAYKASGWTLLGPTSGFGRVAEDYYRNLRKLLFGVGLRVMVQFLVWLVSWWLLLLVFI